MDWTEGYASDIQYAVGFCREQSPVYLNFTCVLNGFEPVDLDQPYTYFELGFGRGLTINLLAASNPQGVFYAADFNPGHVAGAQELAAAAQLANLTLLENSFAELAAGKVAGLPQFDFITMQGIYTWVNAENRRHIVDFIQRYLKPGGIVYVGYNAMPGWSAALPLQRMLLEYAELIPNRSDIRIREAIAFVGRMSAADAKYFTASPKLKSRIEMLECDEHYLVHEYLHGHWQPLYFADVARGLAAAKLDFTGSANLPYAYPDLCLTAEKQELLATINDPAVRETFKDYFLNTPFRQDVFVRGARRIAATRRPEWLHRFGLALTVPREKVGLKALLPIGMVELDKALYGPLLDALAMRPHSLAELAALPELKESPPTNIWQAAALLTSANEAHIYCTNSADHAAESAHRLNRAIVARLGDTFDYKILASTLFGNGIETTARERLLYHVLADHPHERDAQAVARRALQLATAAGRQLGADGKPYESEDECLTALTADVKVFLAATAPMWRKLKMIP
jgi:SAM-dependent methyltransferase